MAAFYYPSLAAAWDVPIWPRGDVDARLGRPHLRRQDPDTSHCPSPDEKDCKPHGSSLLGAVCLP